MTAPPGARGVALEVLAWCVVRHTGLPGWGGSVPTVSVSHRQSTLKRTPCTVRRQRVRLLWPHFTERDTEARSSLAPGCWGRHHALLGEAGAERWSPPRRLEPKWRRLLPGIRIWHGGSTRCGPAGLGVVLRPWPTAWCSAGDGFGFLGLQGVLCDVGVITGPRLHLDESVWVLDPWLPSASSQPWQ